MKNLTTIIILFCTTTASHAIDLGFFDEADSKQTVHKTVMTTPFQKGLNAVQKRQFKKAYQIFSRLAANGDTRAQYVLGSMYLHGFGSRKSGIKAIKWYRLAANGNHPLAQHELARIYQNKHKYSQAFKWFYRAANAGYPEAQFELGKIYQLGKGSKQNYQQAFKWFKYAAAQGHATAQSELAKLYASGTGVNKNKIMAFHWHTKAAQNGQEKSAVWLQGIHQQLRLN